MQLIDQISGGGAMVRWTSFDSKTAPIPTTRKWYIGVRDVAP